MESSRTYNKVSVNFGRKKTKLQNGHSVKKQARKLQATLVRNYDPLTDSLTGVKCRATSVAKNLARKSNFRKAEKKASYDFAHVL